MMIDPSSSQTNVALVSSYNPWFVVLSIAVAVAASYVALDLTGRVRRDEDQDRRWWLIGGASAMGTGIWAMHFIGMLAFQLSIPIRYDVGTVALSLAAAVIASSVALSTPGISGGNSPQVATRKYLHGTGYCSHALLRNGRRP